MQLIHLLGDHQLSPASIRRNISSIKSFHRFLVGEGHLEKDPTLDIETPKCGQKLPSVLDQPEIELILEQPDINTSLGLRDRAMIEFLYATGIRVSELISIKLGNLFLSDSFIRVFGKGSKERLVPIGEWAVEYTDRYLKEVRPLIAKKGKSGDVVFLNHRGISFSRMGLWKIIRKYTENAGITKKASPHIFRHSFATDLLKGSANIREVQELLGHADISTTQIYTHLDREYLSEVHRKYHPLEKEENIDLVEYLSEVHRKYHPLEKEENIDLVEYLSEVHRKYHPLEKKENIDLVRQSLRKAVIHDFISAVPVGQKKCSKCEKIKDLELFYRKNTTSDGQPKTHKKRFPNYCMQRSRPFPMF